jgi:hypothetical protein
MSTSNQNQPESSDEQRFIQRAMAEIDKAEKVQRIKQIVVMGIPFGALVLLVILAPGPGINSVMVGLVVLSVIAKILFTIYNSRRRTILRAIANRRQE